MRVSETESRSVGKRAKWIDKGGVHIKDRSLYFPTSVRNVCVCVCVYVCMYVCVCVCVCMRVCV